MSSEAGSVCSIIGNPDLKPQEDSTYEIGLQQVLFSNLALDVLILQGYQKICLAWK